MLGATCCCAGNLDHATSHPCTANSPVNKVVIHRSMQLNGKIALVTGASRGIGRAIAIGLAKAGALVLCTSTKQGGCDDTLLQISAAGMSSSALMCDISNAAQVEQLAKTVLDQHGRLDILVNNAGITRDGLFLRMSAEDYDAVLATNLRGPFLVCKAFSRSMAKARGGRIINIGSVVGLTGNAGQANYAASKAGLIGLTKSLAQEFAGRGITANVIAPGFITTDMTTAIPEGIQKTMLEMIPLARFGKPEDVANAVVFLSSDAAGYITGQTLVVDGGMTM
ncbi:MAG: 3-oxoacyl-[acyl-carrier-protein] reductase [Planctomycetes bacterium]|nr:3-oxoacyl-[acyl-carrier-protein] reductase [Planctomycetota bacterium]